MAYYGILPQLLIAMSDDLNRSTFKDVKVNAQLTVVNIRTVIES